MNTLVDTDKHRRGENGDIPERSNRIFMEADGWYFRTREGAKVGPYRNERAATAAVNDFVSFIQLSGPALLESYLESLRSDAES